MKAQKFSVRHATPGMSRYKSWRSWSTLLCNRMLTGWPLTRWLLTSENFWCCCSSVFKRSWIRNIVLLFKTLFLEVWYRELKLLRSSRKLSSRFFRLKWQNFTWWTLPLNRWSSFLPVCIITPCCLLLVGTYLLIITFSYVSWNQYWNDISPPQIPRLRGLRRDTFRGPSALTQGPPGETLRGSPKSPYATVVSTTSFGIYCDPVLPTRSSLCQHPCPVQFELFGTKFPL